MRMHTRCRLTNGRYLAQWSREAVWAEVQRELRWVLVAMYVQCKKQTSNCEMSATKQFANKNHMWQNAQMNNGSHVTNWEVATSRRSSVPLRRTIVRSLGFNFTALEPFRVRPRMQRSLEASVQGICSANLTRLENSISELAYVKEIHEYVHLIHTVSLRRRA